MSNTRKMRDTMNAVSVRKGWVMVDKAISPTITIRMQSGAVIADRGITLAGIKQCGTPQMYRSYHQCLIEHGGLQ